jgi:hypothetical protein
MVRDDDADTKVALMVKETKEGSDEGFATAGVEEEKEESVDLNKSLWHQCP